MPTTPQAGGVFENAINQQGMDIRVGFLPTGDDPDSFIRKHGPDAFLERVDQAVPWHDMVFGLAQAATSDGLLSAQEIGQVVKDTLPVIRRMTDPVMQAHYIRRLAEIGQVEVGTIEQMLGMPQTTKPLPSWVNNYRGTL
jgi:DNA primase